MNYLEIKNAYILKENYAPQVTLSEDQWQNYVENGVNTLYGDAIIPGDTSNEGAVYKGHVHQNYEMADYPYPYYSRPIVDIPEWNA